VLQWAANGASLTLQGVTISGLTVGNFNIVK
jgi:hypothetical protein